MCYIPVNAVPVGAILAEPVVANGEDLFPKGTKVNFNVKEALVKFGVKVVRVQTYLNVISEDTVDFDNLSSDYLSKLVTLPAEDVRAFASMWIHHILTNPVKSLMKLLKSYDLNTYQHSINVATLACVFGIYNQLSVDDLRSLILSSLLHDIGKTKVPIEIIHKPDKLTDLEFSIIMSHSLEGFLYLKQLEGYDDNAILFAVLDHHENHNGTGYPRGLSGRSIHPWGQIIHICDVFDALCAPRAYKMAYTHNEALKFIERMSGTMFNPELVAKFVKCIPLYHLGEVINLYGHVGIVVTYEGDDYVLVRCENELLTLNEFYSLQKESS